MKHLLLVLLSMSATQAGVNLTSTPQKFRTFYAKDDPRIPAALLAISDSPEPKATGPGDVAWSGSTIGLVRTAPREPASRRRQFFAGKRYLPDDATFQHFFAYLNIQRF